MDPVATRYIDRDGAALAYQVMGDGPVDVVFYFEMFQHLDLQWTDPDIHHNYEEHARYSRSVAFQRRGFGLSDNISYVPTLEQQADDVLAVMDAVGMRRATLVGLLTTCGALALVAARAPDRVAAIVFAEPLAQGPMATGVRHGWTDEEAQDVVRDFRNAFDQWGSGSTLNLIDPNMVTPYNRRLMALLERSSATPSAARAFNDWWTALDIQDVLRSVQAPTRVLKFPNTLLPDAAVQYVAELMPNASFHALPPLAPGTSIGQAWHPLAASVKEVVTGEPHSANASRFLGTVLFTDIVSSTELLARVGDAAYRDLRSSHERQVRTTVENDGGHLLTVTGDGTMSVFDGPSAAVRCAETICREAEEAGISVRTGIHTGELERDAMNVTGMTVHIGARVGAVANAGEVLVSRTVHDLVAGSGLVFVSRGEYELKGVPGRWELFAVVHDGGQSGDSPHDQSMQTQVDKVVLQTARRAPGLIRTAVRLGNAIERRRARRP